MRLRSQWLMVLLLIPGVARILPAASSPYVFTPSGIGIDDSAACGRTGRVMLGKSDAADGLVVPDVDTAR